jgi:hypothetical protein
METKEPIVTVHVSKDVKPETLQALGEMLKCLLEQIEQGGITMRAPDPPSALGGLCICGKPFKHQGVCAPYESAGR